MTISLTSTGDFAKTESFLKRAEQDEFFESLEVYGQTICDALSLVTPYDTGETARSWIYRVVKERGRITVEIRNTNVVNGLLIAILVQYGHGTGTGGYVQGVDYINPVVRPMFERMSEAIWKEVVK